MVRPEGKVNTEHFATEELTGGTSTGVGHCNNSCHCYRYDVVGGYQMHSGAGGRDSESGDRLHGHQQYLGIRQRRQTDTWGV